MKETVLLSDGDIIAYRTAAAIEKRTVVVTHKATGRAKEFDTRREFKVFLKEQGREFVASSYDIVDIQTPEDASHCMYTIKRIVRKMEDFSFCDRHDIYISGKENFRESLLLPTRYKSNRVDSIRPIHLEAAKDYLLHRFDASKSKLVEADDVLSIRAYEELHKGNCAIIASNDKDTLQASGIWFYNWTEKEPKLYEIPTIGSLTIEGQEVKGDGLKFLAFQLLYGDPVDGYKPPELAGVRFGKKSAYNILDNLYEPDEILNAVLLQYKEWYPEPFDYTAWNDVIVKNATYETILDLYFRCVYMLRKWNDKTTWQEFFEANGVKL
jgi:hypothetical protein